MAVFDFPYHSVGIEYPESSTTVRYGGGYQFASAPNGPDQLVFVLQFPAMWYWYTSGGALSNSLDPSNNALRLQEFYEAHRMYTPFTYTHPIKGLCSVRFAKPLPLFKQMKGCVIGDKVSGGRGHQVEPFELRFVQQL